MWPADVPAISRRKRESQTRGQIPVVALQPPEPHPGKDAAGKPQGRTNSAVAIIRIRRGALRMRIGRDSDWLAVVMCVGSMSPCSLLPCFPKAHRPGGLTAGDDQVATGMPTLVCSVPIPRRRSSKDPLRCGSWQRCGNSRCHSVVEVSLAGVIPGPRHSACDRSLQNTSLK